MTKGKIQRKNGKSKTAALLTVWILAAVFVFCTSAAFADTADEEYMLKVNTQANTVTVYEKQGREWTPVRAMRCSCGMDDGQHETPEGNYVIQKKWRWQKLFHGVSGQYVSQFNGDILFHSCVYSTFGDPDSCIRSEYEKLGENASHGCVRLAVMDARWIYENCPEGTQVTVYKDKEPGPLGKPKEVSMKGTGETGKDPTDTENDGDYFRQAGSDIKVKKELYLEYGAEFSITDLAQAKNPYTMEDTTDDFAVTHIEYRQNSKTPIINVPQCDIDTKAPGIYSVDLLYKDRYTGKDQEYKGIKVEVANAQKQ